MAKELSAKDIYGGDDDPGKTYVSPEGLPDLKLVSSPEIRREKHLIEKASKKRTSLVSEVDEILKATMGKDVFKREEFAPDGRPPEKKRDRAEIKKEMDEIVAKINGLNGDQLDEKLKLPLKNKLLAPAQATKFEETLRDSGGFLRLYGEGKVSEAILAGLKAHYEKCLAAQSALFEAVKEPVVFDPETEFKGESPLFREQAKTNNDLEAAGEVDMEKIEKDPGRKRGGGKDKEPPGGGDVEKLKAQLDAAYQRLYGFLNVKKEAPKEAYDELKQTQDELMKGLGRRESVGEISEEIKNKYRRTREIEKKEEHGKPAEAETPAVAAPKEKIGFTAKDVEARAAAIERRRYKGQEPGFTWAEIDKMIIEKGLKPGSKEATRFMKKWDKEIARKELQEIAKADNYKLARLGTEITLYRITNYEELWVQTEQAGDEKFKQKTRELWKKFAVHGLIGLDEEKKPTFTNGTDLDGQGCLWLMQLAGFDTSKVRYLEHGDYTEDGIYFDMGNKHGVVLVEGGRKVFIDHHTNESGKESSAAKLAYELLQEMGLLKADKQLSSVVDFITKIDNKTYPLDKDAFRDSWRTIYGLHKYLGLPKIVELLKEGFRPDKILSEEDLKNLGLEEASRQQKETVRVSFAKMKKIEKEGWVIPSERFGRIAVDKGKKIGAGVDAARAFGCQTYIIWSPESNSFFITSTARLDKEKIGQGGPVRGYMWLKPRGEEPLTIKLADVLSVLTDGKLEAAGKLADFLASEGQPAAGEKKVELPPEMARAFIKYGQQLYDSLKDDANWEGYDEDSRRATLEIQLKVFFRRQLVDILNDKEDVEPAIDSLVAKINK